MGLDGWGSAFHQLGPELLVLCILHTCTTELQYTATLPPLPLESCNEMRMKYIEILRLGTVDYCTQCNDDPIYDACMPCVIHTSRPT